MLNWLPIMISAISLFFSLWTIFRNRRKLEVENYPVHSLNFCDVREFESEDPIEADKFLYTTILVINSSPIDIGYFELNAVDSESQKRLPIMSSIKKDTEKIKLNINDSYTEVANIYPYNRGVFKAKTATALNILILLKNEQDVNSFKISFKIADKLFFRYKKYTTRHNVNE